MIIETMRTDVLVIGGGGAGARAAVEAAQTGKQVTLACRSPLGRGGLTPTGNGGYHAASQPGDSPDIHAEDLLAVGCFLNDRPLVRKLTRESREQAAILERLGARVDWEVPSRSHDAELRYGRSLFIPGKEILSALKGQLKKLANVTVLEDHVALQLLTNDGEAVGALLFNIGQGTITVCVSKATVLATGSLGEIYPLSAHEPMGIPTGSTGSGYVLAGWAGADLVDMEMVQFAVVPLNPALIRGMRCLPWSPLLNKEGREFLPAGAGGYSPVTAQAVFRELRAGRGPIIMDLRERKPPDKFRHPLYRQRSRHLQEFGATPYQQPISVGMGPLYMMGGVHITERCETTVSGLYAAGEVTGSVHGARRVSGNAFPEMIVFGAAAGKYAAQEAGRKKAVPAASEPQIKTALAQLADLIEKQNGDIDPRELRHQARSLMGEHVHAVRNGQGITSALTALIGLEKELPFLRVKAGKGLRYNLPLIEAIDCRWCITAAQLVCHGALMREESRGFHFREDFPQEKGEWLKHTVMRRVGEGWVGGAKPVVL